MQGHASADTYGAIGANLNFFNPFKLHVQPSKLAIGSMAARSGTESGEKTVRTRCPNRAHSLTLWLANAGYGAECAACEDGHGDPAKFA